MNASAFDSIARGVAGPSSRRATLQVLGSATLLTAAGTLPAEARKRRRRKGRKQSRPAAQFLAQEAPCASIFGALCESVFPAGQVDQCKAEVAEICAALGRCDADTVLNRIVGLFLV